MAKAKPKKPMKPKPKKTTATIDALVLVLDDGEVVIFDATTDGFITKTGVLDMNEVMREAATYNDGGPVDVYRIKREVPLPVHSVPEQLHMNPEDGPLVTPPPKKQRGK